MQNDATVGRVLLASLHQAIAEVLPERLEFYERWLTPPPDAQGLGVASFMAMLSFLQREDGASDAVAARAGQYAAVRALRDLHVLQRAYLRVLPRRLRARRAIQLLVRVLPTLYPETRIDTIRRRGTIFVGVDESPFCTAHAPADRPSCSFYASTITTFLQLLDLRPAVRVSRCRSAGSKSCLLMVLPVQPRTASDESVLLDLADELVAPPSSESVETEPAAALDIEPSIEAPPQIETAPAVESAESTESTRAAEIAPSAEIAPEVAPPVAIPSQVEVAPQVDISQATEAASPVETTQVEVRPIEPEAHAEVPVPEPAPQASLPSVADAVSSEQIPVEPPGSHVTAPGGLGARWAAIAKQTTPRVRLNVEALFAPATRADEDLEAPWHRL